MSMLKSLKVELAEIDKSIQLLITQYEDRATKTFRFKDQIYEMKRRRAEVYEELMKLRDAVSSI